MFWLVTSLIGHKITSGEGTDFNEWRVLKWWQRYGDSHPEIADWVMRRLCVQVSSATSKRAFLKAGLIIRKKRQRLTSNHVDGISLLGWYYKDNGWGESAKRPWCVPQAEGERVEEEKPNGSIVGLHNNRRHSEIYCCAYAL